MPRSYHVQDSEFLSSLRKGNEAAFSWLFQEYFRPLCLFASKIVANEEANDIVQNYFTYLWEHPEKFEDVESIEAYLYTSIRNNCLTHLSQRPYIYWESYLPLTDDESIESKIVFLETIKQLYQYIDRLSPALRKVMRLYYLEGKSVEQVALELNLDRESVRRQRLRGVVAIRKLIDIK